MNRRTLVRPLGTSIAILASSILAIAMVTPTLGASPTPSAAPPREPVCLGRDLPAWVENAHDANDGVPDPTGRIVFGEYLRTDFTDQLVALFAVDPDGSDLVRILDCEAVRPRVSPDGSRVAFALNMQDGTKQVATMALDGSDLRVLTSSGGYADYPDWSPDGTWLLYSDEPFVCPDAECALPGGLHLSLWRIGADGSDARSIGDSARVTGGPGVPQISQDAEARISPDGTAVVFSRIDDPDFVYRLMIRDLDTGAERTATGSARGEEHPEWSPDGRWIIYNTFDESQPGSLREAIERLPSDDASAAPVVLYGGVPGRLGYKPTYAPDGTRIAFVCEGRICTMNADGSDVAVVVSVPGVELNHVAWGVTPADASGAAP